jgi:chemotaxis protein CheD
MVGTEAEVLVAGIGEMVLTNNPKAALVAYGLGSCVALAVWDPKAHVAGLAHFMLPSGPLTNPPVKFVDSGLPQFFSEFTRRGGNLRRAQMASTMEIGKRNAEALQAALSQHGLRLHGSDLGGKSGRTVQLEGSTGRLLVKSVTSVSVL